MSSGREPALRPALVHPKVYDPVVSLLAPERLAAVAYTPAAESYTASSELEPLGIFAIWMVPLKEDTASILEFDTVWSVRSLPLLVLAYKSHWRHL